MTHGSTLRYLFLFCLILVGGHHLAAQRPAGNFYSKNMPAPTVGNKMDCNDAGNLRRFTGFSGESTTFGNNVTAATIIDYPQRPDTIFLCFDDRFTVQLDNTSPDLSGDPDPSTTPGVGYAFYRCAPTVNGPNLTDIENDPCVADDGIDPFDDLAVGIPPLYANGVYDLVIANDEFQGFTIPALFPTGGQPTPVVLTLAPITYDAVDNGNIAIWESELNMAPGQCVNVSTDQTFNVAFLNRVDATNLPSTGIFTGCEGMFDVRGGTPELRGGVGYDITIEEVNSGARAVVTTAAADITHDAVVQYTVPTAGTYRITIEDEFSCSFTTTVQHQEGCSLPVVFNLPIGRGVQGQNFCYPVTVENFTEVVAFQLFFDYDPAVLAFTGVNNVNAALPTQPIINTPNSTGGNLAEGEGRIQYDGTFDGPVDLADSTVIFELCFDILGAEGTFSTLVARPGEFTRDPAVVGQPVINDGLIVSTAKAFLVTLDPAMETCRGDNNGTITAQAAGSVSPYTFAIRQLTPTNQPIFLNDRTEEGNPATTTFNGLTPGQYAVRAISADGTEVLDTVQVIEGFDLNSILDDVQQPSCNGGDDGILTVEVTEQGVAVADPIGAGYTIVWSTGATNVDTIRNLTTGSYAVTVTAPNGVCTSTASGGLSQPAPVQVLPNNPADAVTEATCTGSPDGSITIQATGGTAPYDFDWGTLGTDDNLTESTRDNLLPGAYAVTVTDANGCQTTSNFTVAAAKELIIVSQVTPITCFGDDDGMIVVNGSTQGAAVVGNFMFTLVDLQTNVTGPTQTVANNTDLVTYDNLAPGRYVVILMDETMLADGSGCSTMDTFEITQPPLLEIDDNPTITNETCTVGQDGTITATVTGGTEPYVFAFLNDSLDTPLDTITPFPSLTDLRADTNYLFIVTDANGCTDTLPFRINAPASAFLQPVDTATVSCPNQSLGDAQLSVDAVPPSGETITSIVWYRLNADGTRGATVATGAQTQNNLTVGAYLVEVITSNSCVARQIGIVVEPTPVFLAGFSLNNPTCPGDTDGSITLMPGGGTPNLDGTYNYVWSTDPNGAPITNPAFTSLIAGTYSVTITDRNNCQPVFDTTFVLTDPPAIVGTFQLDPVSCPNDTTMDGRATITAGYSDGTQGTYDFLWTNGTNPTFDALSSTFNNLPRGPIFVDVTDGTCTVRFDTTIASPPDFMVEVLANQVSCSGDQNGTATVNITGGTPDYVFDWSASTDTDNMIEGLAAGTYTVDITDANGCSPGQQTFTVTTPNPLTLEIDQVQTTPTVRCAGDANGRIGVFVSSTNNNDLAAAPYTWSGNAAEPTESLATDLAPGTYSVTVTDVEGCQDSISYTIGEPEAITFSVDPIIPPLCFGETTPVTIDTAFGGASLGIQDFTFSVNNDGFRIPVGGQGSAFAGEVLVTVFDSAGCAATQTFSVTQPPEILIDLPSSIVVELGDTLTRLNPLISPAGDVYTYRWIDNADGFLSSDTVRNPIIRNLAQSIDYTLEVTNANGCQAFADIFVELDANRNVYLPNAFSPNRDGRNEEFRVFTCQGVRTINSFQVFDRWGGLLVEQDTPLPPNCLDGTVVWDGIGQNGKVVNPGVYVYFIEVEFLDDRKLVYRGDITVVR